MNICMWFDGVIDLEEPIIDALEVHELQVEKLRMRGVSELVILKVCFYIPAQREGTPHILPIISPNHLQLLQPCPVPETLMNIYVPSKSLFP